jgi:hypothetical protein
MTDAEFEANGREGPPKDWWHFDHLAGRTRVVSPLAEFQRPDKALDLMLRDAGFSESTHYGDENGSLSFEVWEPSDKCEFVFLAATASRWYPFHVTDLPSFLVLSGRFLDVANAARQNDETEDRERERKRELKRRYQQKGQ